MAMENPRLLTLASSGTRLAPWGGRVVFLEIRKRRWEVSWTPPEALLLSYG